jgi:hypothetical protein
MTPLRADLYSRKNTSRGQTLRLLPYIVYILGEMNQPKLFLKKIYFSDFRTQRQFTDLSRFKDKCDFPEGIF